MTSIPTWLPVVALALRDQTGRVLLQERPLGKHHGGLWEFPGGKVENGENPREALVREIAEELNITLSPNSLKPLLLADESAESEVVLLLYTSNQWRGEIVAQDKQKWGWFTFSEAKLLPLAPMDADLLQRLAH